MGTRCSRLQQWALAALAVVAVALLAWAPRASAADTGTIAVCLTDSTGANLVLGGDQAWYQPGSGSIGYVGAVGPSGCREQTLATGTSVAVWVRRSGTASQHQTVTVPDGGTLTVNFYTTKVTLQYAHSLAFGGANGDSAWFTGPSMELLSDGVTPTHFRLDGTGGASGRTTLLWPIATGPGATYNRALFDLRLIDHTGVGLAGGTASYYLGGWSPVSGQTDANGNLVFSLPADSGYLNVAMSYDGTRNQQDRTQLTSSNFTFQTALATVKLEDADGNPLDTGTASVYASAWSSVGSGSTSGGQVSQEMLPGSYSFAMGYNNTRQQLDGVAISGPATNVVFQTGRLTAYFDRSLAWNNSEVYPFTGTTMEFLPGDISLDLAGCRTPAIPIAAGDHLVKSAVLATLRSSNGSYLAGGVATAYAGGWKSIGTTNGYGQACQTFDGRLGNLAVRMSYQGTSQQLSQYQPTDAVYSFRTANVTVQLEDHTGALLDTGNASYYAGGWHTIGATTDGKVGVEMLPGSYSFAMTYNRTREQQNGVAISGSTTTVPFQTTGVTAQLEDHTGAALDTGNASYYAGGWHTIGATSGGQAGVEMLPGSYSFAMTYNGTREQQNGVAISGSTTTVPFQTTYVAAQLIGSEGVPIDAGDASYYAGGWHTMGTNTGGRVGVEMLPGSYSFAMTYNGTREQQNGVAISGSTTTVPFHTGAVVSASGAATAYYAGGWRQFANGSELLPGSYVFRFDNGTPDTTETVTGGTDNDIS